MGKEEIVNGLEEFGKRVKMQLNVDRIFFFGSRVSGSPHEDSDIDLLIISKDFQGVKPFKRAVKLYDYWELDYPVDFICLTPIEFEKKKLQVGTIRQAVAEGILIKAL